MRPRILKKDPILTEYQRQVLIGHLLGDGCLEIRGNAGRARLMVEQSFKQREFVEWLFEIFKEFTKTFPKEKDYLSSNSKGYFKKHSIYFSTLSFKQFYEIHKMFYSSKKKIIPDDIEDLLTPLSLTVWFMGDGSIKSKECNGRIINTHGFTKPEIENLCRILNKKFALRTSIRRQKDGLQIYISAKSAELLTKLITPYLLPSFYYKLPVLKVNRLPKA